MTQAPDIARIAHLLGDPARAKMLWLLIDGSSRPAGELAFAANVSPSSASAHLAKLLEGGLLRAETVGRHRYFRLATPEVAATLEGVASLGAAQAPRTPPPAALARAMPPEFVHARTCYDHLAGELAVELLDRMLHLRWLTGADAGDFTVTARGQAKLGELGIDLAQVHAQRRTFARVCVDLTQRRHHLGGALGAALLSLFLAERWLQRSPRSRIVSITPRGAQALRQRFAA